MSKLITPLALLALLLPAPPRDHGDAVLEWNGILLATLTGVNPFAQARFAAITHLAVFEAVNAITGEYEPYVGTIQAAPGASTEAAAVTAAHDVLVNYFPAQAAQLDALRDNALASIPDGPAETDGVAAGHAAAAAIIALRNADGSAPAQFFLPPSSNPGDWQLTPSCPPAGGVFLHWQHVAPFVVESSSQFRSGPPPDLTSVEYARDYEEVKTVGAVSAIARPQDRSDVAQFYNALLAVGVWNQVATQVAAATGTSLSENARGLALVNMAISDALVTVMETKYHYALWRPETAIRSGDDDGNPRTDPDGSFAPFILTPCFPSYPSAHASASYAARRVVQEIWGAAGHSIDLLVPSLNLSLAYSTLKQITDDIDDARVFGGIHFRFDQDAGARQGWRVGDYVYQTSLRPVRYPKVATR
jgi:hypothetical protein